jgi:branched-chain amino acid transport system ATP-binding protein
VREGLAIVLERRGLFSSMSVEQNLEVAYYGKGIRSRAAVRKAGGFAAAYDRFPLLYEKRRSPAGSLSGGQQQMLAIGRALICAPRLLMLDEPSLGLAPLVIGAVYEAIRDLRASGISMLLIEENPQRALDVADRVMVMDRGQVRFEASSQLARESPERFRAAYFGRAA